jgi:hypothetical protein
MLCERLTDPRKLSDRHYIAEPKLDGQRAQLHVLSGKTIACYSRRGLDLLRHPGMAWLSKITLRFESAIFDGQACAGDCHEGIQAVFTERNRIGGCWNDFHSRASPSISTRVVMSSPRAARGSRLR